MHTGYCVGNSNPLPTIVPKKGTCDPYANRKPSHETAPFHGARRRTEMLATATTPATTQQNQLDSYASAIQSA